MTGIRIAYHTPDFRVWIPDQPNARYTAATHAISGTLFSLVEKKSGFNDELVGLLRLCYANLMSRTMFLLSL